MIKSVLQAIPSYIMSIYLIPSTTVNEIERLLNGFWWGGGTNNKGIRWMAWDRLTCPKAVGGLGFRDFQSFNNAMIAKQGWRIMNNPDSLLARVLKARYFPNSSLFNADLGYNPSYSWKSLWLSMEVLKKGCRWLFGEGNKVKVMGEPWLRGREGRWMNSPQSEEIYNLYVNQLMVEGEKRWDIDKIQSLFPSEEAKNILSLPLFPCVLNDKLIWDGNKEGEYVVREGYRLLMKDKWRIKEGDEGKNWVDLWSANAPPKTCHMLWRVCRGCIPTRARLLERNVECTPLCPLCNDVIEDDYHAFVTCSQVIISWEAAGLNNIITPRRLNFNNMADLLFDICSVEDRNVVGRVAALIWSIWQNRNAVVWNNSPTSPTQIGYNAFQIWQTWFDAHKDQPHVLQGRVMQNESSWTQPQDGWIKCNVDAGFFEDREITTSACCVRSCNGEFICAQTRQYGARFSIIEGEGVAMLEAVQLAIQKGWTRVVFESDSQSLVNAINSNVMGNSELSHLISSIKNRLLFFITL
jgi:hypothetical protein